MVQKKEESVEEEIQRLKLEKEVIINEKTKEFEDMHILEREVSMACEEVSKVST